MKSDWILVAVLIIAVSACAAPATTPSRSNLVGTSAALRPASPPTTPTTPTTPTMSVPATSPSVALSSPPTGMEERARLVGGEFAIHARRRGGTTIVVMAPA